ncbi:MAG: Hsp20/alpha crystallin family protein [Nitrososphaera sp.]|jgi:HSP20 family protein
MSSAGKKDKDSRDDTTVVVPRFENIFDNFRRDMERMMSRPWSFGGWDFPSLSEANDMRMALYDRVDRGDKYELSLEVPGIEKEKIDVKASRYSIEISGKHSEKTEDKGKRYLYTERLYRSFYRNVPMHEEIVPSRVAAKVENGILKMDIPKKNPTHGEEATRVDVK